MKKKLIFLGKQLFPLMYWSKYKDASGNQKVCVWRQWFGKILWSEQFSVTKPY